MVLINNNNINSFFKETLAVHEVEYAHVSFDSLKSKMILIIIKQNKFQNVLELDQCGILLSETFTKLVAKLV